MRQLVDEGLAGVVLGNLHEGPCPPQISHVMFDLDATVDQAVQYLASLGHRRILLVNRGGRDALEFSEFYRDLSVRFAARVAARINNPQADEIAISGGNVGVAELLAYLERADPAPTALLVEGSARACSLLHELQCSGWSVPERISVIGMSSTGLAHLVIPRLSFVEMPMEPLAICGTHAMVEYLSDHRVVRESLSPRLHWGKTCRAIGESVST
jgi:LacI family transcriptional regulator